MNRIHFALFSFLLSAATLGLAVTPNAGRATLVTIDVAENADMNYELFTVTDANGDLVGFDLLGDSEPRKFSLADISNGVGIRSQKVAVQVDILKLSSSNLNPRTGGTVTIRHAFNLLRGAYRNFTFEIIKTGNTWTAYSTENRTPFHSITLMPNKLMSKIVGVSYVRVNH